MTLRLLRIDLPCALAGLIALGLVAGTATAEEQDYTLGAGDIVRVTVYQNPDLTTEARVSESGIITFPLLGSVQVGGSSPAEAERTIAEGLASEGFVRDPQVNVLLLEVRANQVAVLGHVNHPGRYPLETTNLRLTDLLAAAGGVAEEGAEVVIHIRETEDGTTRRAVDIPALFQDGALGDNERLQGGDILYVARAPEFYIYGEVQRPGGFRLERDMSVMQGLALGGGLTSRGTKRGLRLHRRDGDGGVEVIEPELDDRLRPDDVIYVRESLF